MDFIIGGRGFVDSVRLRYDEKFKTLFYLKRLSSRDKIIEKNEKDKR